MKIYQKYLLALVSACVVASTAFLPTDPLKVRVEQALQQYLTRFPQEKVYLQLDKSYYASGGVIWFKAYVTNDYTPTRISTILYAELLDRKGKVIKRDKLPVTEGGAWGNFNLPFDMAPGDYRIRAYTLWMLNFDPAFSFTRDIHVFAPGPPEEKHSEPQAAAADYAVQFFPEGGNLVTGVESLVAFKAIGQDGYPVRVSGRVTDDQGKVIDSLVTLHDGMGSFVFTPAPGRSYQASVTDEAGTAKTFPLPKSEADGVVLHIIRTTPGKAFFMVRRSPLDTARYNNLDLVAQIGGHLVYFAKIDFSQGYTGGLIPLAHDPAGVMQLTLFTPEGAPLAERIVFVKNKNILAPLSLREDSVSLEPRQRNKFTLEIPDSVHGSFSVAVTDADQAALPPSRDDIVSHLLLTSDIKGFVYNPAWYFSAPDSISDPALDLVMLTNGWRRFTWQNLLNHKYPEIKYSPEPDGIEVKGLATERKGILKSGHISMFLRAPVDSLTYFISGAIDPNGYFLLNKLNFHDSATLYYKTTDTLHKGREVTVNFLSNPTADPYVRLSTPLLGLQQPQGPSLNRFLEMAQDRNQVSRFISNRSVLLKQVDVTATKIPKEKTTAERYTSGMFKSDNGYTFDLTNETLPYTSIFQYLQGRVAGMIISGNPSNPSVRWRGGTPGFFLDEIPVSAEEIGNVSVDDIALVKVYRPPFYGSFGGSSGAIAIYTKRGGDRNYSPGKGFSSTKIMGYSVVRQFYSPDYSVSSKLTDLPDKRVTLYWNPNLRRDSTTHQISFSFYNSDVTKRMRITIEGLTDDGKIAHLEKLIP